MVKMKVIYQGELHCELEHEPSKSKIETDAPKDNHGRGERFSPTDLVGAALGSCILTTVAIFTERDGVSFKNVSAEVEKEMTLSPRRIGALKLKICFPAVWTPEQRKKYEQVAHTCPVARSLNPELQIPVEFIYI